MQNTHQETKLSQTFHVLLLILRALVLQVLL